RVSAFAASALPVPSRGPRVDPDVLTLIASACRDHERLRFGYRSHSGTASRRSVEPYRLVNDRHRWYLVAWGTDRDDSRTFPGRPGRAAAAGRPAFHPARTAARPGDRRGGGPRGGRGDLAVPGPGDRARARGARQGPAADPGGGRAARCGQVRVRTGLGPSRD